MNSFVKGKGIAYPLITLWHSWHIFLAESPFALILFILEAVSMVEEACTAGNITEGTSVKALIRLRIELSDGSIYFSSPAKEDLVITAEVAIGSGILDVVTLR